MKSLIIIALISSVALSQGGPSARGLSNENPPAEGVDSFMRHHDRGHDPAERKKTMEEQDRGRFVNEQDELSVRIGVLDPDERNKPATADRIEGGSSAKERKHQEDRTGSEAFTDERDEEEDSNWW